MPMLAALWGVICTVGSRLAVALAVLWRYKAIKDITMVGLYFSAVWGVNSAVSSGLQSIMDGVYTEAQNSLSVGGGSTWSASVLSFAQHIRSSSWGVWLCGCFSLSTAISLFSAFSGVLGSAVAVKLGRLVFRGVSTVASKPRSGSAS